MKNITALVFIVPCFILAFSCVATAKTYDLKVAVQTSPIAIVHPNVRNHIKNRLISENQFSAKVHALAKKYFHDVVEFDIKTPANTFILAELQYGVHIAPSLNVKLVCVTLKYEFDNVGVIECDDRVDAAIKLAFKTLLKKQKKLYRNLARKKREFHWIEFIEQAVVFREDGSSFPYSLSQQYYTVNTAKQNVRWLISHSLRLDESDDAISFFETGDILGSILSDAKRLAKHRALLDELILRTPKRYRLWPFIMHQAVRIGAPIEVLEQIKAKRGRYDDFLDSSGNTPLVQAVLQSNLAQVKFLIEEGSNPRHENKNNLNAMHLAAAVVAITKNFSVIDALIEHGVDINATNSEGTSPLSMAIAFNGLKEGKMEGDVLVESFSKKGSFVNNPLGANKRSFSPLYLAVRYGDNKAVDSLLNLGAELDVGPVGGQNILQYALTLKNDSISKRLIDSGAKLNLVDPTGNTPLDIAMENGNDEMAGLLVNRGALPGKNNDRIYPTLQDAVSLGMRKLTSALLAKGAKVNKKDIKGQLAISIAFEKQDLPTIILLIAYGANPNHTGKNGQSLVHLAASRNHKRLINLLGERQADFQKTDSRGRTALHHVYPDGSQELDSLTLDLIKILLSMGIDENQGDADGKTAEQRYAEARNVFLAQEMEKRLAKLEAEQREEERRIEREERLARQRLAAERDRARTYIKPYKAPDVMGTFMKSLGRELIKGAHEIRQAQEEIDRENRVFFAQQQRYREMRERENRQLENERRQRNKIASETIARRRAELEAKYKRQRQAEYARGRERQKEIQRSVAEMERKKKKKNVGGNTDYTSTVVRDSPSENAETIDRFVVSSRRWDENAYGACNDAARDVMTDNSEDIQSEAAEAFKIACQVLWSGVHSVDFDKTPALKCKTKPTFDMTMNKKLQAERIPEYMAYANKAWYMWKSNLGCR